MPSERVGALLKKDANFNARRMARLNLESSNLPQDHFIVVGARRRRDLKVKCLHSCRRASDNSLSLFALESVYAMISSSKSTTDGGGSSFARLFAVVSAHIYGVPAMEERKEQFECSYCGEKFNFKKHAEEHERNCHRRG
jgi:hypothetical protein